MARAESLASPGIAREGMPTRRTGRRSGRARREQVDAWGLARAPRRASFCRSAGHRELRRNGHARRERAAELAGLEARRLVLWVAFGEFGAQVGFELAAVADDAHRLQHDGAHPTDAPAVARRFDLADLERGRGGAAREIAGELLK